MQNNIPVIDYSKNGQSIEAIQRCPTGAIVWLNEDGTATKGNESKKDEEKSKKFHTKEERIEGTLRRTTGWTDNEKTALIKRQVFYPFLQT